MSKHLARDTAIWNKLMFGKSRQPIEKVHEKMDTKTSEHRFSDEKRQENGPVAAKSTNCGLLKAVGVFAIVLFFLNSSGFEFGHLCSKPFNGVPSVKSYGGYADFGSYNSADSAPQEIIEVSYPFVPKPYYGKPVYSKQLIDHTFDSYGHPSLVKFSPPKDVDFNKVVLTLNTTVDGVQYDRLAHLYVGGAEIWRTSTIEPGRKPVYSSFKKDVSKYVSLFREKTDVLFQLDNVVTGNLTGAFHVQLYAEFYQTQPKQEIVSHNGSYLDENYKYFDIRKAADKVIPLVRKNGTSTPPLDFLPSDSFSVVLPKVSQNTTRLTLAVFASGNGNEEFWYTNVLDKYVDRFSKEGTTFLGHGPLRIVNVWIDGKKVASQTPQPIIFTGGISPALWSPVVGVDAFDLRSIDLDVSGLLPLLWDAHDHVLQVSVDNGLDEVDGTSSGIGSDWIVSANLLAYENAEVSSAAGEIIAFDGRSRAHSIGISLPYTSSLQQIITGIFEAGVSTQFVHQLKNGEVLNHTLTSFTKGEVSNVQSYRKSGEDSKIVHVGHSSKSFSVVDNFDDRTIHQTDISLSYPLTLVSTEVDFEGGSDLDVSLVHGKETVLKINEKIVMDESNFQNGTSQFHLRESGNYGEGALDTKFRSLVSGPSHKFVYKRRVKAADGVVTSDKSSFKEHDKDTHECGGSHW